jgi:hypothetical protein
MNYFNFALQRFIFVFFFLVLMNLPLTWLLNPYWSDLIASVSIVSGCIYLGYQYTAHAPRYLYSLGLALMIPLGFVVLLDAYNGLFSHTKLTLDLSSLVFAVGWQWILMQIGSLIYWLKQRFMIKTP